MKGYHKQIVEMIEKDFEKDFTMPPGQVAASELDGCIRRSYYNRVDPQKKKFSSCWSMWRGTAMHHAFQRAFRKTETRVTLPVRPGLSIIGRIDAIGEDNDVVEWKTSSNLYYVKKRNEPNEWDVNRMILYMYCNGNTKGTIYYGDMAEWVEFPVDFTTMKPQDVYAILDEYRHRAEILLTAIERDTPPPIVGKRDFDCRFCDYKDRCIKVNGKNKHTTQSVIGDEKNGK